ncbi:hypothetical protein SLA2020_387510 [Shorea laevis]
MAQLKAERSSYVEPLLSGTTTLGGFKKKALKWFLKTVMWLVFISWLVFIFLSALQYGDTLVTMWSQETTETFLGVEGAWLMLFSSPVVILALLSVPLLLISGEEEEMVKQKTNGGNDEPRWRLWTFPVVVGGPLGVVSAAEVIGIMMFIAYLIWSATVCIYGNLLVVLSSGLDFEHSAVLMMEFCSAAVARIGMFCWAFLWLPIARGSLLLQLLGIPFEHACRYHVWLGHLTMFIFTLHGLLFIIAWSIDGVLLEQIRRWQSNGIAYLPGVILLAIGLLLWATALRPVRKQYFELFYYTHHLYILFVIFLALHAGPLFLSIAAGGIFLFMLDRFLRFCQSRTRVRVISVTSFPCRVVRLVLSKPKNLRYGALGCIFVQIREASLLQWHPFSVSSSPIDDQQCLSVLIKVYGEWTAKLVHNSTITASVEGPYGSQTPYYILYEKLVLVAGGIGISPFLAVLSDILHRIRQGKPCLIKHILLVWSVKKSNELLLLFHQLDFNSICPNFSSRLNLEILIHVTQEKEPPPPPLEEGGTIDHKDTSFVCPASSSGSSMSTLTGTGNTLWVGLYVTSATVGFLIIHSLLHVFYMNPYNLDQGWYPGILFLGCLASSVLIFGGLVLCVWHCCGADDFIETGPNVPSQESQDTGIVSEMHYGSRPNVKEIFNNLGQHWGKVDVGVIVCGPPGLDSDVARECRSLNLGRQRHQPIFHFNTHTFDL